MDGELFIRDRAQGSKWRHIATSAFHNPDDLYLCDSPTLRISQANWPLIKVRLANADALAMLAVFGEAVGLRRTRDGRHCHLDRQARLRHLDVEVEGRANRIVSLTFLKANIVSGSFKLLYQSSFDIPWLFIE